MLLAIRLPWVSTTSWSPFVLSPFVISKISLVREPPRCKLNSSLRLPRLAIAVFCDQHYPETRLPRHHLRVRSWCLIEWGGLDHRRHTAQRTEAKRCVSRGGVSRQRACYLALSEYEIHARNLDRLGSDADVNGNTAGTQALENRGHCLAARSRDQNHLCTA